MTSVPHSGAKSVTPGGYVAGGHTPGPWFTEYRANKRGGYSQEVFDSEGEVVATAAWFPVSLTDTTTTTNREANARLIAAAPDAFGLAVDIIQWVDDFTGPLTEAQSDALFDLYRRARRIYLTVDEKGHDASRAAIIAKATAGETRNAEPIHRRDGDEG